MIAPAESSPRFPAVISGSAYHGDRHTFAELRVGQWFLYKGDVCCKVRLLNGANAFSLSASELLYVSPRASVRLTAEPVHPVTHSVRSARRITLFSNGTYIEQQ